MKRAPVVLLTSAAIALALASSARKRNASGARAPFVPPVRPSGPAPAPGQWPDPHGVVRQMTHDERDRFLGGPFGFQAIPGGDRIRIDPAWVAREIVSVRVPQLARVPGGPRDGVVRAHRVAAPRLVALFEAWERAGLLPLITSWGQMFDPRMARGGINPPRPSTHAYGAAFDVSIGTNPQGARGPSAGEPGSVWPLVPIAARLGWWWGGWWPLPDPMHFELGISLATT